MNFQVGDVVRRIIGPNHGSNRDGSRWVLPVGAAAVVWEVTPRRGWLRLVAEGIPMDESHDCDYFELVHRKLPIPEPDLVPDVRTTDPDTSKAAAEAIKPKKMSIKASILDLLDKYRDGLTGTEIAEHTGHRLNSITPRFAELSRGTYAYSEGVKVVVAYPPIVSKGTRNGQIVWVLV